MTRAWAEYVGDAKIRFHFPCGHAETIDYASTRRPKSKRIGPAGARLLARWWSKEKGGVNADRCRKCLPRKKP